MAAGSKNAQDLASALSLQDLPEAYRYITAMPAIAGSQMVTEIMQLPSEQRDVLVSEFASQYLPSFIKACRSHRKDSPPETFNVFLSLFCRLVRTPSFGRYIREHPDAGSLFPFLVTVLAEDCPTYEDLNHGTSAMIGAHVCQKLHDLACVPLFTILHTSTLHPTISAYRLASPPTPTSVFLRRYASILNSQKQLANRPDASPQASGHAVALAGALHFCYWTAGFLKKRWSETEIRGKIVATGVASLPWISCEAFKMGGCRELGEQEVMMVCSRCKSVRYCCKDHQRAHWKSHKPMCFKPAW